MILRQRPGRSYTKELLIQLDNEKNIFNALIKSGRYKGDLVIALEKHVRSIETHRVYLSRGAT